VYTIFYYNRIIDHQEDRYYLPFYSRNFGKFSQRYSSGNKLQSNVFHVSNELIKLSLQPFPYDTDCTSGTGKDICFRKCLKERMFKINRVPYTEITKENELPIIGQLFNVRQIDFKNKTIIDFIYESENICNKKCRQRLCRFFYSKTILNSFLDKSFNYSSRIRANSPDKPSYDIITVINFDLYQLIIFLSSSFGIWFGLCVISLDPVKQIKYLFDHFSKEN